MKQLDAQELNQLQAQNDQLKEELNLKRARNRLLTLAMHEEASEDYHCTRKSTALKY